MPRNGLAYSCPLVLQETDSKKGEIRHLSLARGQRDASAGCGLPCRAQDERGWDAPPAHSHLFLLCLIANQNLHHTQGFQASASRPHIHPPVSPLYTDIRGAVSLVHHTLSWD